MAVFLTIASVIIATAVLAWFWRHDRQRRNDTYVSLLVTLAGTFAGVFLAVWVSDQESQRADRRQLIALLRQSTEEIKSQGNELAGFALGALLLPGHRGVADYLDDNPVPQLATLEFVIESPVFPREGRLLTRALLTELRNLEKVRDVMNSGSRPEARKTALDFYLSQLHHIHGILEAGIAHLEGRLEPDALEARLDSLTAEKVRAHDTGCEIQGN